MVPGLLFEFRLDSVVFDYFYHHPTVYVMGCYIFRLFRSSTDKFVTAYNGLLE